ncbi:sulfotransferase domain-containing protein [Phormidium yuhuli AB48]|uniref:Sulfotransferase domain-containing protein n=1 Tax=Phormidium yuhuli AB48 TaxID=2940671 RepID=A0ABY5AR51_9CYAN|nr:sulfotransferase domain-containing protein [Phormidium yuhuli]USR90714.1 sulfotransferase domain-containing protein [Phormidium yuhuli AB48]
MPDFLIIGAQKGGTTSALHYLSQHPQIEVAPQKEVHYFDLNYSQGLSWYQQQFPNPNPDILRGEASPYYILHPDVPRRVAADFPHIKLIALLRNPVERAISHYHHAIKEGLETLPLEDAIAQEPIRLAGEAQKLQDDPNYHSYAYQHHSYLIRGEYLNQLQRWWAHFPKQQLLILHSDDLYQQPQATLNRMLTFLNLPELPLTQFPTLNSGNYSHVSESIQQQLRERFRPHNQRLFAALNQNWGW